MMMNKTAAALGLALVLPLGGCISLLPETGGRSPRIALDAGLPETQRAPAFTQTLVIEDPDTEGTLNTSAVAVMTSANQVAYLQTAEWADRTPVLMRVYLERRFENESLFAAVGDRVELNRADYALKTDIRAFHIDRTGNDEVVRVALGARLSGRRGEVLGTRIITAEEPVQGASVDAVVLAFNVAADQATDDLIEWTRQMVQDQGV